MRAVAYSLHEIFFNKDATPMPFDSSGDEIQGYVMEAVGSGTVETVSIWGIEIQGICDGGSRDKEPDSRPVPGFCAWNWPRSYGSFHNLDGITAKTVK